MKTKYNKYINSMIGLIAKYDSLNLVDIKYNRKIITT